MDDFLGKKPKKHSDAASATAARFSWGAVSTQPSSAEYVQHATATIATGHAMDNQF